MHSSNRFLCQMDITNNGFDNFSRLKSNKSFL